MYIHFFRLTRDPFSISPDPRYLFMSPQHQEALAHLAYGANSGGGVVVLTGEIGAGKTTVCRCFLEQVPENCNVAYIFNPKLTAGELLQAICEEFHVSVPRGAAAGLKDHVDALNRYLLASHAQGRNNVLIIDEAQNLSVDVLEQLRLLTNLETTERKLLQVVLLGQPELRGILARPELEQLAQRVIARYHLGALSAQETASYIQHRLSTSGLAAASPFQPALMKQIHRLTQGVPRRINLLCDRALLGAYALGRREVDRTILDKAASELFGGELPAVKRPPLHNAALAALALAAGAVVIGAIAWTTDADRFMQAFRAGEKVNTAAEAKVQPVQAIAAPAVAPVAPAETREGARPQPVAAAILSEQDGASKAGLRGEDEAIRQLANLWGASINQDGDPCETAAGQHLRCYRGQGLAELRQLDRPAVIALRDADNRTYHVLLTGMDDTGATLRAGDATQKLSMAALTRYFRGEFALLWRAPQAFAGPVKMGDSGAQVDWIAVRLAKVYGGAQPAADQAFDLKMQKQLREFQAAQGLFVDGIAGPVTLMHLNRVAGLPEPRLLAAPALMNANARTEQ